MELRFRFALTVLTRTLNRPGDYCTHMRGGGAPLCPNSSCARNFLHNSIQGVPSSLHVHIRTFPRASIMIYWLLLHGLDPPSSSIGFPQKGSQTLGAINRVRIYPAARIILGIPALVAEQLSNCDFLSMKGEKLHRAPSFFDLAITMLDPGIILALVQGVGAAAKIACDAIDKVKVLDQEVKYALQDLRQGIDGLKSDTMVYKVLITAMQNDTNSNGRSVFETFIQKSVWSARVNLFILIASDLQFTDKVDKNQ